MLKMKLVFTCMYCWIFINRFDMAACV